MVKKAETTEVTVQPLKRGSVHLRIIGLTPLFQNRMASKAKQQLLTGGRKKSKADRAAIKHDPITEFRDSAEILPDGPTALGLRVVAVKAAMCTAALETPGLTKTSAQRLLFMPGDFVPLYGIPQLRMDVTRSADINRTPDIRTRCYLPKWGAEIETHFITPQLSVQGVVSLLCNAGILIGVGDYRQEKGKGSFGSFRVLGEGEEDAEWDDLVKNHGRAAQQAALTDPEFADRDTEDLMEHFFAEVQRRAA
ncbi:hypothetical protein [Bradyrhizobium uaiense]|uniref:Uncharacterized protein n=1 Tax=Bradyrhizobium uaiense TaxID=2594946 RepID=A0A6P1B8Y1_9BRAD|nr:hypothetical protein [Bradyrhizobium uaiense]NEU94823.1 hypothetical protein [Bradyrhizobium uaiense]